MSEHIAVEELADAAEGLLEPARSATVRSHLAECATCSQTAALLSEVSRQLGAEPVPDMPEGVVSRLDGVLAAERARRAAKGGAPAGATTWTPRPRLVYSAPSPRPRGRLVLAGLAAAAVAALAGFGGYVVSAAAGLNEPPSGVAALSSRQLGTQAGALEQARDLGPHWFSRAWSCARGVTSGRITGLAFVTVDGSRALLVYTRQDDQTFVTAVTGCDGPRPAAGASTLVPER